MRSEEGAPRSFSALWKSVLAGAMIGLGGILPGVSGGILAVSFGLYRPILDAIAEFFKHPKKSFLFLLPIGLGAAAGFFLGSLMLHRFAQKYYNEIMYLFVGLVVGGIPSFLEEANSEGFKKRWLVFSLFGALLASSLLFISDGARATADLAYLTPIQLILTGLILSVGVVIPGVSSSFILMYLGWYRAAMATVANVDIVSLLTIGVGVVSGALLLIKTVRWLFSRFRGYAYYSVLGFLLVSAALIFPGFSFDLEHLLDIAIMMIGFFAAYMLGKAMKKLS